VPGAGVVEVPAVHRADAWWVVPAVEAVASAPGRVVHAASGDGWLVRRIIDAGGDAYGVDPRTDLVDQAVLTVSDLRGEDLADHLRAVAPAGLGAIVLSGVVDGMAGGERAQLLHLIGSTLAPGGVLVVHSLSRVAWDSDDAPFEADLAPGRPLRATTWQRLLEQSGYHVTVADGPAGADYLVFAVKATVPPPEPTPAR
jgi:SAM-dependent methyltransferase